MWCRLILVFLVKCACAGFLWATIYGFFGFPGSLLGFALAKTSSAIPENLLNCYRSNFTSIFPRPPLTMRLLVEIIQKIELDDKNSLNMRLLTTSMLHGVRLDGILKSPTNLEVEYLVPFRARGMQFYKYQLLVDYLISGERSLFPENSITTSELCLLHEMISNTVNPWERGDEKKTCPLTRSMPDTENSREHSMRGELSRCPQESGVVQTEWGTVSPGHLVAGVAAALQETTVQLRKLIDAINDDKNNTSTKTYRTVTDVNNVWASTIVGDIAEVVVNQNTENPIVGNVGFWNDTYYPRAHYLTSREWDLTDAELLGGIDGALIANEVAKWTSILDRTRFSQILDMYYSNRGVCYEPTYRACNRQEKFNKIYQSDEAAKQAGNMAKLLQIIGTPTQFIEEEGIDVLSKIAERHYKRKAESKMSAYTCGGENHHFYNSLEVILIMGGSWIPYDARQTISAITDVVDVSHYGSKIGMIDGHTGKWMTNVTGSLIKLYTDLSDENIIWPTTLSLSQSLEAVISYYQNKTTKENCAVSKTIGKIIMVLTNSARISDVDYERTIAALRSIKNSNPEVSVLYATTDSNVDTYEALKNLYENDLLLKNTGDLDSFKKTLRENLIDKPGTLINFYCNDSTTQYEVYVTPNVTSLFEINNAYIRKAEITVKFKGNGYGDLVICAYDSKMVQMQVCKTATDNDVSFYVKDHCSSLNTCNVYFTIVVNNTKFKCAELECRYPDQARVNVYTSWTKRSGSGISFVNSPLLIFLMAFVLFYNKRTPLCCY